MPERIVIASDICNGQPVIRGTRIAVHSILDFLAAGDSVQDVLEEFPSLTVEDVRACLGYASQLMRNGYSIEAVA